jgi:C4-dicarboxylate-specific signal transduction histidine kinase
MILLRAVIFLALVGAGIWYFLAEPDRRAALDAIEQDLTAEAELRREALTKNLRSMELSAALIARSAPVATLLEDEPEPEPQQPAAQDAFDRTGFARPEPAPVTTPDGRAEKQALQELKSLEVLTGLSTVRILKSGETETLPPLKPPTSMLADGSWQAGIDAAFQGQPERAISVGDDGEPSYALFTPYFSQSDVPAIVIAEAGLSDAKSQWEASEYRLSLTGGNGAVILSNSVDAGGEVIEISREVPALNATISVATRKPEPLGPWAIRSGAALVIAILVLLLFEVNISRRRLRSEASETRRQGDMRPEEVIVERTAAPGQSRGQQATGESLALLAQVSDAIGQEINRPLSAIRNHAEAAYRSVDQGQTDSVRDNIRHVSNLADRIARIVANMRGFVANQPYQVEPVSIRPAVHDAAVNMLERDPALGDFFFMEVADDVPEKAFVRADKIRLSQVIDSLLSSSWDACRDQERPELVISIKQTRGNMVIAIDFSGRPEGKIGPDGRRVSVGEVAEASGPVAKSVSFTIAKSIVEGMGGRLIARDSALGGGRIEIVMPKFKPNAA